MPTINRIQKLDGLTELDMIPVWDFETSSTKAIEFGKLVKSIDALQQTKDITEQDVLNLLKAWFVEHPALTQTDVDHAISVAFQSANIPNNTTIDGRVNEVLRQLGWTVAPLTQEAVTSIIQQYLTDNGISGGASLSQADVETILVRYMQANGDQVVNTWVQKYMSEHPFPAVPTTKDIETIIYNYIVAHPEMVGSGGGGSVDNETIQAQIAAYFTAHPIKTGDGLTAADVGKQISDYLTANPPPGQYDAEDINQFITNWVSANPNAYKSGFNQSQVETIIANWLKANPDKIVLPDTVMQSSLLAATAGANLNDTKWQNRTFWAVKSTTNYPAQVLPNAAGAVVSDCAWYDESQRPGRIQFAINADGFAYRIQTTVAGGTATTWGSWGLVDFSAKGSGVDPADIEAAVQSYLGQNPPSGAMREAASWAALSLMTPSKEGERVWLRGYNSGKTFGSGFFVGYKTAKADDAGFICSNGGAYYWQRDIEIDKLNVNHFGAIPDGVTDASGAVYAMFKFLKSDTAKSLNPMAKNMPVRFAAGGYMVNPVDFSKEGRALTETEIQTCAKREAWRRLVMNQGQKTYTTTSGTVITRYQDMDPALGQRVSEQENPTGYTEIDFIGFAGPFTPYGRLPQVQLRSNKADDTFVFLIQARRCQVHGLRFDGQITQRVAYGGNGPSDGSTRPSNTQGFLKNYCIGGQFWNVTSFQAEWVGGKTFFIKDSLDAKFEQIYSGECWDSVIYSGWTNAVEGNWDHATALELCNCNFQQQMGPNMPPVYMPRMAQSIIRNVWIEHSLCPMDLTDWQGTIDMLCIESSIYPVHAWGARFIFQSWSNPTGVVFDTKTQPYITQNGVQVDNPNWYSYRLFPDGTKVNVKLGAGYEHGSILLETYGVDLDGVMIANVYQSGRTCNPFPEERWTKIGRLEGWAADGGMIKQILAENGGDVSTASAVATEMRLGCQAELRLYSSRLQAAAVTDTKNPIQPGSPGVTVIRCNMYQGGSPSAGVTWHTEGDPVVVDIAVSNYLGNITFWAKLPAKTRELGWMLVATGVTRFNAGQSTNWVDGNSASFPTANNAKPTGEVNFVTPQQRWAVSTKTAGIGLTSDGRIMMQTVAPSKVPTGTAPSGYLSIYVNGVEKCLPYYDPQ